MRVDQAIAALWRAGYRAQACTTMPDRIVVLDPVVTLATSEAPRRVEHTRRTLHPSQVARFLADRR